MRGMGQGMHLNTSKDILNRPFRKSYRFKTIVKVGLSPSKKICFICFNESP